MSLIEILATIKLIDEVLVVIVNWAMLIGLLIFLCMLWIGANRK